MERQCVETPRQVHPSIGDIPNLAAREIGRVARPGTDAKSVGPQHRPGRVATRFDTVRIRISCDIGWLAFAMVRPVSVNCGWRRILSLRDPAALSGRPGHPTSR